MTTLKKGLALLSVMSGILQSCSDKPNVSSETLRHLPNSLVTTGGFLSPTQILQLTSSSSYDQGQSAWCLFLHYSLEDDENKRLLWLNRALLKKEPHAHLFIADKEFVIA